MAIILVGEDREFQSIQAAIDAASDGDTIIIDAGTYDESPVVNKSLTIQGAQAGTPGTSRDPANSAGETNITGEFSITAAGDVTIDGVRIVNDATGGAPSVDVISTGETGHTITNSIIFSTVQGGNQNDIAIAVRPGSTGTVTITDNAISGTFMNAFSTASFQSGIFFDGGGRDLVVTGNLFEFTRAGLNLDIAGDSEVTVSDNTFRTNGTAFTVSQNADGLTATDNDLRQVGTDFSFRNTTTGVTFDAGEAIDMLTPVGNANDLVVVLGGAGEDTLTGSEFADVLDGNNNPAFLANNIPTGTDTDADTLRGLGGDDQLFGRGGNDDLDGGAGNDRVNGNEGDDIIRVSSGVDFVFGDSGTDTLVVDYSASTAGVFVDESRLAFGTDPDGGGTQGEFSNGVDSSVDFRSIEIFDVTTGSGNDSIRTGAGNDRIILNAGNDTADAGAGNDFVDGGAGNDTLNFAAGGDDMAMGGEGDDFLFFGNAFTNADSADGGAGTDTLALAGNYSLTFDANDLVSIERLSLLAGNSSDPEGAPASYNLTTIDANVAAGQTLFVQATSLREGENLAFNGTAETDGSFNIRSGAGDDTLAGGARADRLNGGAGDDQLFGLGGNDTLIGGLGTDTLRGGGGSDIFRFESADDSSTAEGQQDQIVDFQRGFDKIDLSAIDADETTEGNQAFTFVGEASFSSKAGELRSSRIDDKTSLVEGDTDGDGVADFAILVTVNSAQPLTATDFIA
jgi:Ca2+-binding RTX toxin-like protein